MPSTCSKMCAHNQYTFYFNILFVPSFFSFINVGGGGKTLQYCKTTTTSKIITFSDIFSTVRKLQNLMLSFYRNPNLERKLYNHIPVENFQTCRKILIKKIRISSAIYNFENITLLFLVLVPLHVIIGLKKKNQYERKCDGRHTSLRSSCRSIFFPKKTTLWSCM